MPRKNAQNPAEFNVRVTVDRLTAYLLEAEDVVGGGGKLKDSSAMLRASDTPIATPSYIAMAQLCRHAVPESRLPRVAFKNFSGSCPAMRLRKPSSPKCKPCSAAEALSLLVEHEAEAGYTRSEAAIRGEGLGPDIVEFVESAARALEALFRLQIASRKLQPAEAIASEVAAWLDRAHRGGDFLKCERRPGLYLTLCEHRATADILVDRLLAELPRLRLGVANMLKSPQLRESLRSSTKPKSLLLNWITFTLHEGGFKHAEIVRLVDDGSVPIQDPVSERHLAAARVRERLRSFKRLLPTRTPHHRARNVTRPGKGRETDQPVGGGRKARPPVVALERLPK